MGNEQVGTNGAEQLVNDANQFLALLNDLLNEQVAESIPPLAKKIRCQSVVKVVVGAMESCLGTLDGAMGTLRGYSVQATAVQGLLGVAEPLIGGVGELVGGGKKDLEKLGMSFNGLPINIEQYAETGKEYLQTGNYFVDLFPKIEQLDELQENIKKLKHFSRKLKNGLSV